MSVDTIQHHREHLCTLGQRMWQRDFCAGCDGNLSLRLDDERLLVTPTGVSKGFMSPQAMCVTDMRGHRLDVHDGSTGVTSEVGLHVAIYAARADVGAVIHAHPPYATAWACTGLPVPGAVHCEAVYFLSEIPVVPYQQQGTPAVGLEAAKRIKPDTTCLLLANHGAVAFGPNLDAAYHNLEMLERYMQVLTLTQQIGAVQPLDQPQVAALLKAKRGSCAEPKSRLV